MESTISNNTLSGKYRQIKGCSDSSQRQDEGGAAVNDRNGFLKSQFLPMIADADLACDWKKKQATFFTSLGYLAALYNFEPLSPKVSVYPDNIWLAYNHAKAFVEVVDRETELYIVEKNDGEFLLATGKTYSTKSQLYFFPLEPVHRFLQQKDCKATSKLLLSILAYCFQVLQLPSYTEGDYLDNCYNYFRECLLTDGEEDNDAENINEIDFAFKAGEKIARQCKKPYHLTCWKKRIDDFAPAGKKDECILAVAKEAFILYELFPSHTFNCNICPSFSDPKEERTISPDQYISFSWPTGGWLQEQEFEFVNNDLQEMSAIDEPIILQCFDKPQEKIHLDDSFEIKLFSFLQNFSTFLYNDL